MKKEYSKNGITVNLDDKALTVCAGNIKRQYTADDFSCTLCDNHGLSGEYTVLRFNDAETEKEIQLLPRLGIYIPNYCGIESFDMKTRHLRVRAVTFTDRTDYNDTLVSEVSRLAYCRKNEKFTGNIYIICDYLKKKSLVIVTDNPAYAPSELTVNNGIAGFDSKGYGAFYGICDAGDEESFVKTYYRFYYKGSKSGETFIMSNTWGDRSMGNKLGDSFIRRELDAGAEIGVDIVQIDDGWQKGITYDSSNIVKEALVDFKLLSDEFWELDTGKFPNGIASLSLYAKERGISLGIWFIPESYNAFEHRYRDLSLAERFYSEWNARYIKLDGVIIAPCGEHDRRDAENNYLEYIDGLSEIGKGELDFNLDITASDRFGYFLGKQYGTIFVENRYTDWGNYYPHSTLRNLWQLSHWIPCDKFQFEVLNNSRNRDQYPSDPIAPYCYDIDYLFASVMLSNPLIWMEMQNLGKADVMRLNKIINVYKSLRHDFFASTVTPIGDEPDGASFTGFRISGKREFFLVFREYDETAEHYLTADIRNGDWKLIVSNTDASAKSVNDCVLFYHEKPLSYALFELV